MRMFPAVLVAMILAANAVAVASPPPPKDLVKAELRADVKTVRPGERFTVGVLLKIKPGWHVYWLNPGDSGLPTRVKFNLPEGFTAGPLKYPLPVRFDQAGGILGYGYHDEVML